MHYYMPSTFYIVKLPLALGNISIGLNPLWHSHMTMPKIHIGASLWILALPHSDDV